jgi:ATP-binding cassette subfamily B protein
MHRFFHHRARLSALVNDSISGMRVIKAFGRENLERDKFEAHSSRYRDSGVALVRQWSLYHPILHFLIITGSVIVWFVGGRLVFSGSMTVGSVVAYSGYLMMFYRPVFVLTRMVQMILGSLSAAQRLFEVLDTEPEITDRPGAVPLKTVRGAIAFTNVTFGYAPFKPVLKGMNLTIRENEIVGLAGASGAGKSTMINLLCRLYDPDGGAITLDGVDIRDIRYNDLRAVIGVVPQDVFLFNGSIYDNIAYASPETSREKVIEAAIAANAHEFIRGKPDGYDTEVGERGNKLSGGEKQRIAIARALVRDPRILILDEATSSVDAETEGKIQQALERLTRGRTTIAIAHRLSTLRTCDRLFVIEDGRVAETGSHEELIARKGAFFDLVNAQRRQSRIIAVQG